MILIAAVCCFGLTGICGVYRLLAGPGLGDRVMAVDVILIALMGAISIDAVRRDDSTNLILLVVIAVVGFTATIAAGRFLESERSAPPTDPGPVDPAPTDPADDDVETDDPEMRSGR